MLLDALSGTLDFRQVLGHLCYLASIILFIVGIQRLGKVKTARQGNHLAAAGMALAVIGQFVEMGAINPVWIIIGMIAGSTAGAVMAVRVKMTEMPEMVGLLNGFGGLASMLVAIAVYAMGVSSQAEVGTIADIMGVQGGAMGGIVLMLTIIVGAVTFTGSMMAFCKLSEAIKKKFKKLEQPILVPGRHAINGALLGGALLLSVLAVFAIKGAWGGGIIVAIVSLASLAAGIGLVMAIGGGDMPVVISLLNSYSGIAGALAGFTIGNYALIVSGSLVGASGIILTNIMCKAMNRSLTNVIFGGFGAAPAAGADKKDEGYTNVKSADSEEAAQIFADARSVVIVPGYGMAVAQAQHAVREFASQLEAKGCQVRYAIHPVAGRMPGHMNVLLAEANVPYDRLYEMDQINNDFRNTDVSLVIGANDVVNPAAKDNPASPIYGMPILNVQDSGTVFVIKRSLGAGFAGIKNELFEKDNTLMIFGDAKKVVEELGKALKEA